MSNLIGKFLFLVFISLFFNGLFLVYQFMISVWHLFPVSYSVICYYVHMLTG